MKFYEIDRMISERVKQQILDELNQRGDLPGIMTNRDYLACLWDNMSSEEQQVIHYFLLHKGQDFLTYREMEHGLGSASFRIALTRLRRKGVLYTIRRLWGELAFVLPEETVSAFRRLIVPFQEAWTVDDQIAPSSLSYHIMEDIFQALNNVKRHPLELTRKGTIQRRSLKVLFQGLTFNRELASGLMLPAPPLPGYEPYEAMFLDLLASHRLLMKKGDIVHLGEVHAWVSKPRMEMQRDLFLAICRYLDLDPKLEFLCDLMIDLPPDRAYSLQAILDSMGSFAPEFDAACSRLIDPLERLGFIHTSHQKKNRLWKWNSQKEMEIPFLYIQPNFQILVPSLAPMSLRWKLSSFTYCTQRSEMLTYELNRDSIQSYFEAGGSGDDLVILLRSLSSNPVPDNVERAIIQWYNQFQCISFFDARLLKVKDAAMAAELESIPPIAECFLQRVGPCHFVVNMAKWDTLLEELEKRGYAARLLLGEREDEGLSLFQALQQGDHQQGPKVESVFPELADAIPGFRHIPRMWISNYQAYHGSTVREIVQKAIQMEMEIRMEIGGKERLIQPKSLVNEQGYWMMVAQERNGDSMTCRLEDIGKVQLSLPIFNGM